MKTREQISLLEKLDPNAAKVFSAAVRELRIELLKRFIAPALIVIAVVPAMAMLATWLP